MNSNAIIARSVDIFATFFVIAALSACSTPHRYSDETQYLSKPMKAATKDSIHSRSVTTRYHKARNQSETHQPAASENSGVASKLHEKQKAETLAPAAAEKVKLEGDDVKLEGTK